MFIYTIQSVMSVKIFGPIPWIAVTLQTILSPTFWYFISNLGIRIQFFSRIFPMHHRPETHLILPMSGDNPDYLRNYGKNKFDFRPTTFSLRNQLLSLGYDPQMNLLTW